MKFSIQTLIWFCVLLALLIAGTLAFIPKPIAVDVATVEEGPLKVVVKEDGKTRIREKYIISAPVSGRLQRIELEPADDVVADQTLVAVIMPADPSMLDARTQAQAEARVDQAETAVKRAETNIEETRINLELSQTKFNRARQLLAKKAISEEEHDFVKASYLANSQQLKTAEFDLDIAEFELEMAKAALMQYDDSEAFSLEPFEVIAPISGQVLRIFQESSRVLALGTPLVEMGDPRNLEMEIDVLSTDAVKIKPGAKLTVQHWGGKESLHGIVRVVEPAAFTKVSSLGVEEQRVNVIADFDEPGENTIALGDGYRIEAEITVEEAQNVVWIPSSALFRYNRKWHVFAIAEDRAALREVRIGLQNDNQTQILEGLQPMEEVVVYPSDQLKDGSRVQVVR
ncbi:MAG: efflux RND transporter periplasmic adaptor subunit [bacterium]|nr:efflux RND transporter periplasmic adaptor subunit [bacterium]